MMKQKLLVMCFMLIGFQVIANDINYKDLKRSGNLHTKKYTISGLKREGDSYIRQFNSKDTSKTTYRSTNPAHVIVTFNSVCGLFPCIDKNLSISGGPGRFKSNFSSSNTGTIYKGSNGGLAGNYNWSASFNKYSCSGSFYLSGKKGRLTISSYKSCSTNYNEY